MSQPFYTFFLIVPILIWAFITFDDLIELEYKKFHAQWKKDGQPPGLFWRPDGYQNSFSSKKPKKYSFIWLFKKPVWINGNIEAIKLLNRYRILVVCHTCFDK
jgi:ferric iron reductase protein FhuF